MVTQRDRLGTPWRPGRGVAPIDADPAALLALEALAAVAGYAKPHFIHRFATVVGQTPGRYQTGRRMELARRLLKTTDLDVTTICHRVGYASLGSFSDAFHRAHGRPPSAWRRRREALAVLRGGRAGAVVLPAPPRVG